MLARLLSVVVATLLVASPVAAQVDGAGGAGPAWRAPGAAPPAEIATSADRTAVVPASGTSVLGAAAASSRAPIATVTKGNGTLPNDQGQVWREYDISSYTLRVTSTNRPEQAIVDWILRETGYEAWHSDTVAMLSANRRTLRTYHTPEMQRIVGEIVDRFVNTQAESHAFGIQVLSLGSPNWRARSPQMLHAVPSQTPGVQAWLLAKEDVAALVADISRRTDFRSLTSPHLIVNNGQSTVITLGQPRNYVRGLAETDGRVGLQPDVGQVFEGFSLELGPLVSLDGRMIDAVLKCNVDQIEKMVSVRMEMPGLAASRQLINVEVPQRSGVRLQERFHWPVDKVLLVSLGVVPSPSQAGRNTLQWPLGGPARADMLLLVESKGNLPAATAAGIATQPAAQFVR